MSIKFRILAILVFFPYASLFAQTPSYYHYTTTDGLASSTDYQIIQDRDGFIWFATINGVSKFDGKRFTTFRTIDGLNSNSIISIAEGNEGELYFGNYEKGINILKNGKIENYFSKIKGKQFTISYLLFISSEKDQQKLYAYNRAANINVIHERIPAGRPNYSISMPLPNLLKIEKLSDGKIIVLTTNGLFNLKDDALTKLHINGLPDTAVYCLTESGDGGYYIGTKGMIYLVKNNTVHKRYKTNSYAFNNDVMAILKDKNNNLWFSVMNRGFFFIQAGSDNIVDIGSKMGLQNTLVNNYLEDNEGNIWISTYGKGVYCLNNLYLKSYNEIDGMSNNSVYSISKEKSGKLMIGTFNGVNILENGRFDQIKSNSEKTLTEYIHKIKNINGDFYICGSFGGNEIKKISYKGMELNMFDRQSFCKTVNGLNLFGTSGNFIIALKELNAKIERSSLFFIFGDSAKINRVNEIFEDTQRNLWIGTSMGLCKLSNPTDKQGKTGWQKSFFPGNPVLNSRINSIFQDKKNTVWFAGEKGIASYNLINDSVKTYTNIADYDLSSSTSIISDNKNRIWVGNMKGLYLIDGSSVKYLNSQTGLPSDEVLSLYYDSKINMLYVGTSNGISFLNINMFDGYHPSAPSVTLNNIMAGDSVYKSFANLVFKPEQHDITINFKAVNFSSPGSVKYKYRLNDEWLSTDYDFLNFISLENGTYKLQIMAKAQNTDWCKPYLLTFSILPAFVETIWFKLLLLSLFLIAAHFTAKWRLWVNNKKNMQELEISERINELKHKALSAMMNPHFISNALNSVQYLVNSRQYEEANNYIAMMAKLMRKNLDTAGSGFILLSEEISRLKLYLDLEKLRFQESFAYEIITGTDVDPGSVMIPNMIIQPFVENSLWHGIINSGHKGLLTVSFTFEDVDIDSVISRSLIIRVTDNGIGIQEAKKHKKDDHISKGIQIIEERLRLLSAKMQLPQPIMFEDLNSRNNNSHGTEVIISLPPQLYRISIGEYDFQGSITVK